MFSHPDRSTIVLRQPVDKAGNMYHEIALTKSGGGYTFTNEHMLESTRKKPAHLGASDGFIGSEGKPGKKAKVSHKNLGTNADRKGRSPAIVVYPTAHTQMPAPKPGSAQ
jgi:hypothetical protein